MSFGTRCPTEPLNFKISLTTDELTNAFCKVGIKYIVSIFLSKELFAYPICNSYSKSLTALRPRIIVSTSSLFAKSTSNVLNDLAETLSPLVAFSINSASKVVMAMASGGRQFSRQVALGLILQVAATWFGWWIF